jgi:hypothetical protein
MKKIFIYVDTSVIGGCSDPEFKEWSPGLLSEGGDEVWQSKQLKWYVRFVTNIMRPSKGFHLQTSLNSSRRKGTVYIKNSKDLRAQLQITSAQALKALSVHLPGRHMA